MTFAGLAPGITVATARRVLAQAFRAKGLDAPDLDARLLVGHALGIGHAALASDFARALSAAEIQNIAALAARRSAGEPIARIFGEKEFWGLTLRLNGATLVPRPDTETLVEAALAAIDAGGSRQRALRIADLGTGSGALLLALLHELPRAYGVGTDRDISALVMARENAARLGLGDRAGFVSCDFGAALAGGFDLVVSNPPYIASAEIAALAPEVLRDPRLALDGGADGLDCYRAIAADARRLIAQSGSLVLELGVGQDRAVSALLAAGGLDAGPLRADLGGVPRALTARVPGMAMTPKHSGPAKKLLDCRPIPTSFQGRNRP